MMPVEQKTGTKQVQDYYRYDHYFVKCQPFFSYICLFVSLRPQLTSHWSPAYAVKQTPLINASVLTSRQMKGEAPICYIHSFSSLFVHSTKCTYNKPFSRTRGGPVNWKVHIFVKALKNKLWSCSPMWRQLFDRGWIYFVAVCLRFFVLCLHRCSPVLLQAISEVNRKQWMEAMDGKEPVSWTLSLLRLL